MWGTAARVVLAGALGSAWAEVASAALIACTMLRITLRPFGVAAAWMHSLILPLLQVSPSASAKDYEDLFLAAAFGFMYCIK